MRSSLSLKHITLNTEYMEFYFIVNIFNQPRGEKFMVLLLYLFTSLNANTNALYCDRSNYPDYIWNKDMTDLLVHKTKKGCQLKGVNLNRVKLENTYFYKADLRGVKINNKNLSEAIFDNADLRGAVFSNVVAFKTSFCGADLSNAKFSGSKTDLSHAVFDKANLDGADFSGIHFNFTTFFDMDYDEKTTKIESLFTLKQLATMNDPKDCREDDLE